MSRTTKPLTDAEIKKAQVKEKEYKLSDGNGLYLVIKTNGTKFFRFDFSYGGKRKSMSFGVYPGITLKEARDKREESKKQMGFYFPEYWNVSVVVKCIKQVLEDM